uniref:Histone-lysine N-methyltransferase, H3 lysine-79 specific n=1 Tax=Strongyloides papillosus TaxID=174720 RepID=A0A0N5C654_STREA
MQNLFKTFNKSVRKFRKSQSFYTVTPSSISMESYEFIENYIYAKIFKQRTDPNKKRQGFYDKVYGKILNRGGQEILKKFSLKTSDTLFDLGSGIGLIILQAATTTDVGKVVGIELVKEVYDISINLKNMFIHVMKFGNFKFQKNFEIINDDFLVNSNVVKICSKGSAIFINDKIFQPPTLNQIRDVLFYNLRNGVKKITVQNYKGRYSSRISRINNVVAILSKNKILDIGRTLSYGYNVGILHYYEIYHTKLNGNIILTTLD